LFVNSGHSVPHDSFEHTSSESPLVMEYDEQQFMFDDAGMIYV
jgi:hypothetical protein